MNKYKSHKTVEAFKILDVFYDYKSDLFTLRGEFDSIEVTPSYHDKHRPSIGGYFVRYEDGYESFSPAEAFESGYSLEE